MSWTFLVLLKLIQQTKQKTNRTNENKTATNTCCIYQTQTHLLVSLYTDTNRQVKWHLLYNPNLFSHTQWPHMEYKTVQLNQTVFLWLNNRTGPHCRPLVRTSNSTFFTKTSPRGTLLCLNQCTLKNEWVQLVRDSGLKSVKSFGTLMSQNNLINLYVLRKMTATINSAFKIVNLHRRISQPQESWKALVKTDVHWVFERHLCNINLHRPV